MKSFAYPRKNNNILIQSLKYCLIPTSCGPESQINVNLKRDPSMYVNEALRSKN